METDLSRPNADVAADFARCQRWARRPEWMSRARSSASRHGSNEEGALAEVAAFRERSNGTLSSFRRGAINVALTVGAAA